MSADESDHELTQRLIDEEAGKVVDEYDRLPPDKQQEFLDGLSGRERKTFQRGLRKRGRA